MKKKYILYPLGGLILLVLTIGILRYAIYNGYIRMNYPSYKEYPVRGIDISHHQGFIDWNMLDKEDVQFVFMKATEGENHRDSLYVEYRSQAISHNIPLGAYHFFTFCKSGDVQARNYIANVPNDIINILPIVDLEYGGNCKPENRVGDLLKEIGDYISAVEKYYQKRVLIYTTNEFYNTYLRDQFPDNPIWIRDIISEPDLKDNRVWTFWQFTNRGRLDGIGQFVDLNVFYGNEEDFIRFRQNIAIPASTAEGQGM